MFFRKIFDNDTSFNPKKEAQRYSQITVLDELTMAKPRHKVHAQTGAKTISQSSKAATNLQPPFTLFYVSRPDALLPMKINNEKIFIVGSSPLAFSTTEELCTQRLQETPIMYLLLFVHTKLLSFTLSHRGIKICEIIS